MREEKDICPDEAEIVRMVAYLNTFFPEGWRVRKVHAVGRRGAEHAAWLAVERFDGVDWKCAAVAAESGWTPAPAPDGAFSRLLASWSGRREWEVEPESAARRKVSLPFPPAGSLEELAVKMGLLGEGAP